MSDEELKHWGVKGMKWGIRRYQPYQKGDGPKGKFIDAHKRADSKKAARRAKGDARLKKVKDREKAQGKAAAAKVKSTAKKAGKKYMDASKKHEAKTKARRDAEVAQEKKDNQKLADIKAREKQQAKDLWSKPGKAVKKTVDKVISKVKDKKADTVIKESVKPNTSSRPSVPKDPENYDHWTITGGDKTTAAIAIKAGGYANESGTDIYFPIGDPKK